MLVLYRVRGSVLLTRQDCSVRRCVFENADNWLDTDPTNVELAFQISQKNATNLSQAARARMKLCSKRTSTLSHCRRDCINIFCYSLLRTGRVAWSGACVCCVGRSHKHHGWCRPPNLAALTAFIFLDDVWHAVNVGLFHDTKCVIPQLWRGYWTQQSVKAFRFNINNPKHRIAEVASATLPLKQHNSVVRLFDEPTNAYPGPSSCQMNQSNRSALLEFLPLFGSESLVWRVSLLSPATSALSKASKAQTRRCSRYGDKMLGLAP